MMREKQAVICSVDDRYWIEAKLTFPTLQSNRAQISVDAFFFFIIHRKVSHETVLDCLFVKFKYLNAFSLWLCFPQFQSNARMHPTKSAEKVSFSEQQQQSLSNSYLSTDNQRQTCRELMVFCCSHFTSEWDSNLDWTDCRHCCA